MKNNKEIIIVVVVVVLLLITCGTYIFVKSAYNKSITFREDAKTNWSYVESAYQRRNDLIGNLVSTVKGAADFEKTTLSAVIEARAKATQTTVDVGNIDANRLAKFQSAQSGLSSALSRLLVTVERYPELKANRNFLELQSQLEGTENRINIARDRYNSGVNRYNKHIKVFPNNIVLEFFGGVEEMARYKADKGSEKAPEVKFDFEK